MVLFCPSYLQTSFDGYVVLDYSGIDHKHHSKMVHHKHFLLRPIYSLYVRLQLYVK